MAEKRDPGKEVVIVDADLCRRLLRVQLLWTNSDLIFAYFVFFCRSI